MHQVLPLAMLHHNGLLYLADTMLLALQVSVTTFKC
jgi:hypothetical protein